MSLLVGSWNAAKLFAYWGRRFMSNTMGTEMEKKERSEDDDIIMQVCA